MLAGLGEKGLELRLALDGGSVRVELRDAAGAVVREVSHAQLLEALGGSGRGLVVDEQG